MSTFMTLDYEIEPHIKKLEALVSPTDSPKDTIVLSEVQLTDAADLTREIVYRTFRISRDMQNRIDTAFSDALRHMPDECILKPLVASRLERFRMQIYHRHILVADKSNDSLDGF